MAPCKSSKLGQLVLVNYHFTTLIHVGHIGRKREEAKCHFEEILWYHVLSGGEISEIKALFKSPPFSESTFSAWVRLISNSWIWIRMIRHMQIRSYMDTLSCQHLPASEVWMCLLPHEETLLEVYQGILLDEMPPPSCISSMQSHLHTIIRFQSLIRSFIIFVISKDVLTFTMTSASKRPFDDILVMDCPWWSAAVPVCSTRNSFSTISKCE